MDQLIDENDASANLTDLSIEAVLELAEVQQGLRNKAPSLTRLFESLSTPAPSSGGNGISMLADVRSYAIFRDSLQQAGPKWRATNFKEVQEQLKKLFDAIETGVASKDPEWIEIAKRFCSAINSSFVAKQMGDIYARRERSDARYISHESSS